MHRFSVNSMAVDSCARIENTTFHTKMQRFWPKILWIKRLLWQQYWM